MKIEKYYTLLDCYEPNYVLDYLDNLQNDSKLEYILDDSGDNINIIDHDMDYTEIEELLSFFKDNDVRPSDSDDYNIFMDGDDFSDFN
jgi:hypothetical protein